jgi:hypothetical protein
LRDYIDPNPERQAYRSLNQAQRLTLEIYDREQELRRFGFAQASSQIGYRRELREEEDSDSFEMDEPSREIENDPLEEESEEPH